MPATITKATRVWTCSNCEKKIMPGENMIILPGAQFFHYDHAPNLDEYSIIFNDIAFYEEDRSAAIRDQAAGI